MPRAKINRNDAPTYGDRVLLKWYDDAGKVANEAARKHVTRPEHLKALAKQITRAVQRRTEGGDAALPSHAKSKGGRTPGLDRPGKKALQNIARRTAVQRNFIRPDEAECKRLIHEERARMLVRLGKASAVDLIDMNAFPIDAKTEMKYIMEIWPEKEEVAYKSAHRDEVKREIRNNISCCAVTDFVFRNTNPCCIETSDHFAVYRDATGALQSVRSAAGSGEAMRKEGWSVGHGGSGDGAASCKLPVHGSMTMAKQIVALIAEIWDDQLVKPFPDGSLVKIYPIDATDPKDILSAECFGALIVHGTPHDVVMHSMYKDIIIPKMCRIRDAAKEMAATVRSQHIFAGAVPSVSVGAASVSAGSKRAAVPSTPVAARSLRAAATDANDRPTASPLLLPTSPLPRHAQPEQPVEEGNLRASSNSRRAALGGAAAAAEEPDQPDIADFILHGSWVGKTEEFDIILCLDGDSSSITAILSDAKMKLRVDARHPKGRLSLLAIIELKKRSWGTIRFLKWAAGCTPMQSPNDAGKAHCLARVHVKGSAKKPVEAVPLNECSACMQKFHRLLESTAIKPARKVEFWRLISNLPFAKAVAFSPKVIRHSWSRAGFMPFSHLMILSKCSLWDDGETFTVDQKRRIVKEYPLLFPAVKALGRVPDKKMNQLFDFLPPVEKLKHALEDLAVNRDRVAILSHENYFSGRVESSADAHADDGALRKPKAAKPAKAVEWLEYPAAAFAAKCGIEFIKGQLKIRGVQWGRTTRRENLLEMWRVNSALPIVPAFARQPGGGGAATAAPSARPAPPAAASFLFGSDGRVLPMEHFLDQVRLSGVPPLVPSASGGAPAAAPAAPAAAVQLQAAAPAPAPAQHVAPAATQPRKVRACSMCNLPGHQRNNCPNKSALVGGAAGLPPSHAPKSPDEFAVSDSPLCVNTPRSRAAAALLSPVRLNMGDSEEAERRTRMRLQ
jgi:hypothetical protein